MTGQRFFNMVYELIRSDRVKDLSKLVEENKSLRLDEHDFENFIVLFSSAMNFPEIGCVNINGSGGSGVPKINITSIACVYIAAIAGVKVVKTGSVSNTSLAGSTDFFERLGLLHATVKDKGLEKYNFAYYDYLQISAWKRYREILTLNQSLNDYICGGVFFDYPASTYCMGIALDCYYDKLRDCKTYNAPTKLITFYTDTKYGVVDEITQGDIYVNGNHRMTLDGDMYMPHDKEEVLKEDIKLIYGLSDNKRSVDTIRFTTALLLDELIGCGIEKGISLFNTAYSNGVAGKLVDGLINLYKTQ